MDLDSACHISNYICQVKGVKLVDITGARILGAKYFLQAPYKHSLSAFQLLYRLSVCK